MSGDQGTPGLPNADVALSPRQRVAGTDLLAPFDTIEALLFAAAGRVPEDPLVSGYLAGARVQGERLSKIGGAEAMRTVLDLVTKSEARAAHGRRRLLDAAWSGLPGWKP